MLDVYNNIKKKNQDIKNDTQQTNDNLKISNENLMATTETSFGMKLNMDEIQKKSFATGANLSVIATNAKKGGNDIKQISTFMKATGDFAFFLSESLGTALLMEKN